MRGWLTASKLFAEPWVRRSAMNSSRDQEDENINWLDDEGPGSGTGEK